MGEQHSFPPQSPNIMTAQPQSQAEGFTACSTHSCNACRRVGQSRVMTRSALSSQSAPCRLSPVPSSFAPPSHSTERIIAVDRVQCGKFRCVLDFSVQRKDQHILGIWGRSWHFPPVWGNFEASRRHTARRRSEEYHTGGVNALKSEAIQLLAPHLPGSVLYSPYRFTKVAQGNKHPCSFF